MFSRDNKLPSGGAWSLLRHPYPDRRERTVVTCPSLLRRRYPAADEFLGERAEGPVARLVTRLRRDDVLAQFARFVLVGGASTAAYALLFVSLHGLGYLPANIGAATVSSILANDMHRRLTFHAEDRVGFWTAQVEAGAVSLFGLTATSLALAWLDAVDDVAPTALQIALVAMVTGVIGLIRFAALRWIFRPAGERASR
jgi:putative flippase GtrA